MTKRFGLWVTVFFMGMVVVGCTSTGADPHLIEPTSTVALQPTGALATRSAPESKTTPTPPPSPQETSVPTPLATPDLDVGTTSPEEQSSPDMVVVVAGDSETYVIKAGQTFVFQGSRGPGWQIGYDQDFLTLLTPEDIRQQPGDSWLFQANEEVGRTRIWLTNVPLPCAGDPCPPAPGASIEMEAFIEIVNP